MRGASKDEWVPEMMHAELMNFAVGPVPSNTEVRAIGSLNVPYFRTGDFSEMMLENDALLCELAHAPVGSRSCFITGSGTAAMEAAVMGLLDQGDRALIVDGGSFGHRFREMLELHHIDHDVINLDYGFPLTKKDLAPFDGKGYTAFLVNLGETSQGILYSADLIADFCRRNSLFLIVDAISSFLADPFDMSAMGADVMITDAQKALACQPGVAPVVLSPTAIERAMTIPAPCMYLDFSLMLKDGKRGQTPFTPAISILMQINLRLRQIIEDGGEESEIARCATIAKDFRSRASVLPFEMRLISPSNAVTYLTTGSFSARRLFEVLKDGYGIWVCPNGGKSAESSFRVGHIGQHKCADNAVLVAAITDALNRGLLTTGA